MISLHNLDAPPTAPLPSLKAHGQGASYFTEQVAGHLSKQIQHAANLIACNTDESVAQACNLMIQAVEMGLKGKVRLSYD